MDFARRNVLGRIRDSHYISFDDFIEECFNQLNVFWYFRGQANEWCEAVSGLIRQGISLRRWFVIEVLLTNPDRIVEYLMDCPIGEVRFVTVK